MRGVTFWNPPEICIAPTRFMTIVIIVSDFGKGCSANHEYKR